MFLTHLKIKNWRNFRSAEVDLGERTFLVGPNACGKSNFLDIFRFMRDIAKQPGGGLQKAVSDRGGLSKIRCLAARKDPIVELEFHFSDSFGGNTKWKYLVGLRYEVKGRQRTLISKEVVWKNNEKILERPDKDDKDDEWRLTQTHLEQINSNLAFRDIYDYFYQVRYSHIIPQLLRRPDIFFNTSIPKEEDAFGFHFLESIVETTAKTQVARLKKIEKALQTAVPQLKDLSIKKDDRGVPHLEASYEHWPPKTGKQREDQFSDGTLRLIGFLWSLLETSSLVLLEEPELSLHSYIVKKIPSLISQTSKKKKQQLIISTHSPDLLSDPGMGGEEILLFYPKKEGTKITRASDDKEIRVLLENGLVPSEVVVPYTNPEKFVQGRFFDTPEWTK
jgi:predicted ATPase